MSYVAIDVGWAQAARFGLLLAGLAAAVTLYPELRKIARRR